MTFWRQTRTRRCDPSQGAMRTPARMFKNQPQLCCDPSQGAMRTTIMSTVFWDISCCDPSQGAMRTPDMGRGVDRHYRCCDPSQGAMRTCSDAERGVFGPAELRPLTGSDEDACLGAIALTVMLRPLTGSDEDVLERISAKDLDRHVATPHRER